MLTLTIPGREFYDEKTNKVFVTKDTELRLEHSLVSLSKWEMKYQRPFLSKGPSTIEEVRDYVKMMTITQNVDPNVYLGLTPENFEEIKNYMANRMTASIVKDDVHRASSKFITNEIIYAWMVGENIPLEFEKWHLNRLLNFIKICIKENGPKKKMSQREVAMQQLALNKARRAKH